MGGTTIIEDGKTKIEVLEKLLAEIISCEKMGLFLDSDIIIIEKNKPSEERLGYVYLAYYKEHYENFEGFIGKCHLHS